MRDLLAGLTFPVTATAGLMLLLSPHQGLASQGESQASSTVEAPQSRSREELEQLLKAALLVSEQRFLSCDYNGEVEAQTAVVRYSSELGRPSWIVTREARWLDSARRAALLPQPQKTKLREARRSFVEGNRLFAGGHYAAAEPSYRLANEIASDVLGLDAFTVETARQHGDACNAAGKFADAVMAFESSVLVSSRVYGDDHPVVGDVLSRLADAYAALGRLDDANAAADKGFAIKAANTTGVDLAVAHLNLARVRVFCLRYEDGEREARQAIATIGPRDSERARYCDLSARQIIADALERRGSEGAARRALTEALAEAKGWPSSARIERVVAEMESKLASSSSGKAEAIRDGSGKPRASVVNVAPKAKRTNPGDLSKLLVEEDGVTEVPKSTQARTPP